MGRDFSFLPLQVPLQPDPFFYAAVLTSWNATTWFTYLFCMFCRCDGTSEGIFSFLEGWGLYPRMLALEPSTVAPLGISGVCICHLLILSMV